MTAWDARALGRALGATVVAFAVVWLVTAASDEGQLTIGARAGRTLPLAPVCSALGAALALGAGRVREETRALEALGRRPIVTASSAALGGAIPSLLVALAIFASGRVEVAGFYPRAPTGDAFTWRGGAFESPTMGVRIVEGEARRIDEAAPEPEAEPGLPPGARGAAAAATALAGAALALVAARGAVEASPRERRARRRRRLVALAATAACALLTLVAFQAAAAGVSPPALAALPPAALLGAALLGYRPAHERAG